MYLLFVAMVGVMAWLTYDDWPQRILGTAFVVGAITIWGLVRKKT